MIDRRMVVTGMGSAVASAMAGLSPRTTLSQEKPPLVSGLPEGVYDTAILYTLPGKKPLIKLTYRPPNYETPVSYFKSAITPNDAFLYATTSRTSRRRPTAGAGGCNKMINVFGAPIEPGDAAVVVDYLVKHYGTGE